MENKLTKNKHVANIEKIQAKVAEINLCLATLKTLSPIRNQDEFNHIIYLYKHIGDIGEYCLKDICKPYDTYTN